MLEWHPNRSITENMNRSFLKHTNNFYHHYWNYVNTIFEMQYKLNIEIWENKMNIR